MLFTFFISLIAAALMAIPATAVPQFMTRWQNTTQPRVECHDYTFENLTGDNAPTTKSCLSLAIAAHSFDGYWTISGWDSKDMAPVNVNDECGLFLRRLDGGSSDIVFGNSDAVNLITLAIAKFEGTNSKVAATGALHCRENDGLDYPNPPADLEWFLWSLVSFRD